jgi:hypothetical protein
MKEGKIIFFVFVFLNILILGIIFGRAAGEVSAVSSVSIGSVQILVETFDGDTTNFTGLNNSLLENISGVVLEKTSYGKVEFNENLDLVASSTNNQVDFDSHLSISSNLIDIDNLEISYLEKNVSLVLYGISFVNPTIMKGAVVCDDCILINYSGGEYSFTSDSFEGAYYLVEGEYCGDLVCNNGETTATCLGDCPAVVVDPGTGGGGGGGGGGSSSTNGTSIIPDVAPIGGDFYLEPNFLALELKKGTYFQKDIKIVNNGTQDLTINVFSTGVQKFVFPEARLFTVKAGENYTLRLNIYVSTARIADVYVGKVIFQTGDLRRDVHAILNIAERRALFDIRTEVLKKYVAPGGRVRANVSIINMGDLRDFDVSLEYKILDFDNKEYSLKKEDFAMNRTHQDLFFLESPTDLPIGRYLFYSKVSYEVDDVSASSYDTFVIESISYLAWIIVLAILVLIIVWIIIFLWKKREKEEDKPKKPKFGTVLVDRPKRKLKVPEIG